MQASILRGKNLDPISFDQLREYSPAAFAREAHSEVSSRYGFVPTYKIIEAMHSHGLVPVEVRNYARKNPDDMQYTKHMIRFRQAGKVAARTVGDVVPQVVLINSHDRSSRFQIYGGLFRQVCANGLLVSTGQGRSVEPIVVRHTTKIVDEVVGLSENIIQHHAETFRYLEVMRKTTMKRPAQIQFASDALHNLRPQRAGLIDPESLLVARRSEDEGDDVWRVFNRVQENMTKGGINGVTASGRRVVTAEIKAMGVDVEINKGLWEMAMNAITKAQASAKRSTTKQLAAVSV